MSAHWCCLRAGVLTLSIVRSSTQDFYEDIFEEVDKFGEIEHLNICDNLADHMVGNVYIKFK